MSKDEAGCKLTSVYKHKERKPKKPHYIPRPWGKPYNYKCFQCPFTCMEKSHLYNHMKYSLCKNSLSLLIESDWPYKKGNLLHPDLRLLHAAEASRARGRRDEPETCDSVAVAAGTMNPKQVPGQENGSGKPAGAEDSSSGRTSEDTNQFQEEEEEEEEEEVCRLLQEVDPGEKKEKGKEGSPGMDPAEPDMNTLLFRFKNKRDKPCKDPTPDFIITDVFSLKNHVMKGKDSASLELEAKARHCKVPKKCPVGSSGVLMEQWKLVANGQRRATSEVPAPCPDGNIIPCYPPPAYGEYHEPQSVNLSLLGINYPLSPNLFSYLSPSVASSATPHPHLAQLPFLASTAQLMQPHPAPFQHLQNPDRSAFLPRFYYPLLFEHSFSATESKMAAVKPESQQRPGSTSSAPPQAKTPTEPSKVGHLKVPVLKTGLPWGKSFQEEPPPEQSHKTLLRPEEEEKWMVHEKESSPLPSVNSLGRKPTPDAFRSIVGLKDGPGLLARSPRKGELPMAPCLDSSGSPVSSLKRKFPGNVLDSLGLDVLAPRKVTYQASNSLRSTSTQLAKSLDHWHVELHACPPEDQEKSSSSDLLSPGVTDSDHPFLKSYTEQAATIDTRDPETTTMLIGDLSKTLEEYQEVEKKLSDLAKEDTPGQKQLREQLVKIRQELFHIHQALEKATKPNEGPLDLSVKRSSRSLKAGHPDKKEPKPGPLSGKLQSQEPGFIHRCASEAGKEDDMSNCLLETDNKTIDLLIKMSRSENLRSSSSEAHLGAVIKAEVLPLNIPLELRHVMDPYYSRTTKCEADSSVLLCTDGRANASQGPTLSMSDDLPLGCRALPRSLSCSLPNETDGVCLHSPLNTDP